MAFLKLCAAPHCREIVRDGHSKCLLHRRAKRRREPIRERGAFYQTARWRTVSKLTRQESPVCLICKRNLSEDVDHWVELSTLTENQKNDLAFDPRNLISTCKACHRVKSTRVYRLIEQGKNNELYQYLRNNYPRQNDPRMDLNWLDNWGRVYCFQELA
ncbi:HNH endonuclease [Vibrio fluvialis]|nr:HNH endonuclease [Vibrio fluvialis]